MGLAGLKKTTDHRIRENISPEEFITGSDRYAGSYLRVVDIERISLVVSLLDSSSFKKATFSLTHNSIDMLTELSSTQGNNKSLLLRQLIHYFYLLSPEKRYELIAVVNKD